MTSETPSISTEITESVAEAAESVTGAAESPERRTPRSWMRAPRVFVPLYTLAMVICEGLGAFVNPFVQSVALALLTFAAVNHAIFGWRNQRTAAVTTAALSSVRLFTVVLPISGVSIWTRSAMIGACSIITWYTAARVVHDDVENGRQDEALALKKPIFNTAFTSWVVVASAIPISFLAYYSLHPRELILRPEFGSTALPWLAAGSALAIGALGEELLYRRLVAAMVQHTGRSQTPVFSAILFGASYLGYRQLGFVALTAGTGLIFAWSCERTGSIKAPVFAHILISVLALLVLPAIL